MVNSTNFDDGAQGNRFRQIFLGAMGFGLSFVFFGAIHGGLLSITSPIGYNLRQGLIALLYACAGGFGALAFAIDREIESVHLFGAGAIGCGLGYFISVIARHTLLTLVSSLAHLYIPFDVMTRIELILEVALMGAVTGAFLGLVWRSSGMVLVLALAGTLGFAVGRLVAPSSQTLSRVIFSLPMRLDNFLLYAMMQAVYSGIIGVISGGIFSWVIGLSTEYLWFPTVDDGSIRE